MATSFGVRSFFPGANAGLRQFFARFNLIPPVSLRTLAANAAIAQKYQQKGGYKGPLGVALSPVGASTPGSFVQSFEGGQIHFTGGQTTIPPRNYITIAYRGAHCFGEPKFPHSHAGYVVVIIYKANNKDQAVVVKLPDDAGGDTYNNWNTGVDETQGQAIIFGADTNVSPSDIVIETLVMGHEVLGDPKQVKKAIQDAVQKVADEVSAAEGVPPDAIPRGALDLITTGLFEVVNSLFGLTDQVRGSPMSKTIGYADWFTLPVHGSKQIGPIPYNWETDIMTDGDASYKAYFDLVLHSIQDQN